MNRRQVVLVLVFLLLIGLISGLGLELISSSEGSSIGIQNVNVRDGRLVEYDFDFGENGTVVPNRAGSDHEGLIRGNVTRVSRNGDPAIQFNGTDDVVIIEDSNSVNIRDGVTVSFWLKSNARQKGNILGEFNSYWFFIDGNTVNFNVVHNGTRTVRPSGTIPIGKWTHIVGSYDPEQGAQLYVNGAVVDNDPTVNMSLNATSPMIINPGYWKNGFNGSIDEFSMWNRSLSKTEVEMVKQDRDGGLVFSSSLQIATTLLVLLVIVGVSILERSF